MALSANQIQILSSHLDEALRGDYLQGFNEFDQESFFWSLSNKSRLVFVLTHGSPKVYIGGSSLSQSSLNTAFASSVRKLLSHAKIESVTAEPNERILYFQLERTNEVYKKERVTLVFELLPNKPRLLLLDEEKKILLSTHYSPLDSKRPLLRGMTYVLPEKGNYVPKIDEPFSYQDYTESCLKQEEELVEKRKANRFADIIKRLKSKEKAAKKKIEAIEKDIEEAKLHIDDSSYGDYIYTEYGSFKKGDAYFDYEGKKIPLDPKKSPQENATAFYKKAKKAKLTLEVARENLRKAKEEEENAVTLLSMIETLDGANLEEVGPSLGILPSQKEKEIQGTALLPYEIIDGSTRILFGKNAKQNEFLSFLYTSDKEVLWFHVQQGAGSHVILFGHNPSKQKISLACQVALIASEKESGEVMYTQRKNIKRGSYTGQAIVKSFESAYFPNVTEEAKNLCKNAVKVKITRHLQAK